MPTPLTTREFDMFAGQIKESIVTSTPGERIPLELQPGSDVGIFTGFVAETAKGAGYMTDVQTYSDLSGASVAFTPMGPEPVAPSPAGRAFEQDPYWKRLSRQHEQLGLQLNQLPPEQRGPVVQKMEQIGQRMQRRAEKVTQGPQYDQQMLMYQTAMAARAAGVTYSTVPPPGGTGAAAPAQQAPAAQPPAGGQPPAGTTVIPPGQGGAAAGAGGTGGGGATTTTIPPTG